MGKEQFDRFDRLMALTANAKQREREIKKGDQRQWSASLRNSELPLRNNADHPKLDLEALKVL